MTNRDVVAALLERLGKPWSLVRTVPDRPGHDRRYALDGSKLAALGWRNRVSVRRRSWPTTVDWYRAQRAVVAGREVRRTGTPTTSASTGPGSRRRRRPERVRVAVTGAGGRLGGRSSRRSRTRRSPASRADRLDPGRLRLDAPERIHALLDRDRPEAVVTRRRLDGRRRLRPGPVAAPRARNGDAVHVLAEATAARGMDLVHVSTNEVFDGRRDDGRGYGPEDRTNPINPYGASKLAGEIAATAAYRAAPPPPGGRRTAWLYGPPGNDFPAKILARPRAGAPGRASR
jgi:nucleoside-diphosphate-sugar epimerase